MAGVGVRAIEGAGGPESWRQGEAHVVNRVAKVTSVDAAVVIMP